MSPLLFGAEEPIRLTLDGLLRLAGRLHPVLVHFPIALVIVAALLEGVRALGKGRGSTSSISRVCVILGAAFGAIAAWFGWIGAGVEPPGSSVSGLVFWHRWVGVGAAIGAAAAAAAGIASASNQRFTWCFRGLLLGVAGAIGLAGHLGGELVHGEGHLVNALRPPIGPVVKDPADAAAPGSRPIGLAGDVLAIFDAKCVECHGFKKRKGGLRLDSIAHAVADETVVAPGYPEESELYLRVTLAPEHEDFMPPEGDPLTPDEIERLRAWILLRAWDDASNADGQASVPDPARSQAAVDRLRALGVAVVPTSIGAETLEVNASVVGRAFTDEHALILPDLGASVVRLDLSGTGITDAAGASLAGLPRLGYLSLARTSVGSGVLPHLLDLRSLRALSLFQTRVDDAGLEIIEGMDPLERVYLSQTLATPGALERLAASRPRLVVEREARFADAPAPAEPVALPGCCQRARDAGGECDHACCVDARSRGEVCARCLAGG